MLSLEQVRGFVVVAEELHFGRAAERLRMTQPPLSRQIQKLERSIGVTLFERGNRSVRLTDAGRAFLAEARHLLALADRAPDVARRIASGSDGRLAIGFTATAALGVLGPMLRQIDAAMPTVDVLLSEHVSAGQTTALLEGRIDLGLMRLLPVGTPLSSRLVHRERLLAAVPTGHRLASTDRPLSPEALEGERMVMYSAEDSKYFHDLVGTVLGGIHTRSTQRVTQIHSMTALVAAGRGAAIVPESASTFHVDGVTLRPIAGWEHPVVELRAVWRDDATNPALARALNVVEALSPLTP